MSVLCRFALRKVNGIICTHTLGCSIDDIDVVISYEFDRIGRTSRAGNRVPSSRCLVEAGRQPLEPIEIYSKAEGEYAVMYSAVLNDLCEGCEALDLEKQTIKKISSKMLIASMTKVNLLSKLKDRVDIDPALPAK